MEPNQIIEPVEESASSEAISNCGNCKHWWLPSWDTRGLRPKAEDPIWGTCCQRTHARKKLNANSLIRISGPLGSSLHTVAEFHCNQWVDKLKKDEG